MRRVVLVIVMLCATATAHADKKRQTATVLSAAGTAAGSGLVLAGFLTATQGHEFNMPILYAGLGVSAFAPSLGEWYAGQWLTIGMGVRVAAAGLATYAATNKTEYVQCQSAAQLGQMCEQLRGTGVALIGVAAIAFIGGMAYDVQSAADAADDWNRRHSVMIVPTTTGGAPGASLVGSF